MEIAGMTYYICFIKLKTMGLKVEEPKKIYSFRAKPSIIKKVQKKLKQSKINLSNKIETLLNEYAN